MSQLITVSATEARNNFFELFNQVYYGGKVVVVKKAKKKGGIKMIADLSLNRDNDIEDFIKDTYGCLAGKSDYWSSEDPKLKEKQIKLQTKKLKGWR